MKFAVSLFAVCLLVSVPFRADAGPDASFAGSASCLECHEKFYQLWSSSRHGLAMQPYSSAFARKELTPQEQGIVIQENSYRADLARGVVEEQGPNGAKEYRVEHIVSGSSGATSPPAGRAD